MGAIPLYLLLKKKEVSKIVTNDFAELYCTPSNRCNMVIWHSSVLMFLERDITFLH